jgi:hypothetical protein
MGIMEAIRAIGKKSADTGYTPVRRLKRDGYLILESGGQDFAIRLDSAPRVSREGRRVDIDIAGGYSVSMTYLTEDNAKDTFQFITGAETTETGR